ncbi:Uncharacterized protein MSYG_1452 [Malassezia sympodialis ATCC 42132]|uniref:RNase III domain-containing protein n=1 Tax=Malassezia sympodialis (strain ATCC 42132) TaxID=1230383 RepID=A0A1M8A3S9_MALS4|nr:Uncharacterized protein MSYG_1452 [Malassezia sympodialis ATCC 42132]
MRAAGVARIPVAPSRAFSTQTSYLQAGQSAKQHGNQTPQFREASSPAGPLGINLTPTDILSHLNSAEFSSYRSSSEPSQRLLGAEETLATTALTHESWMHGLQGHNRRLAFLGRRVLKTYLTIFLFDILSKISAESASDAEFLQNILSKADGVDQIVATHQLGDTVGRQLGLEKVMRWHPSLRVDGASGSKETGLFKVRGTCVEAVVGAIYHYKGALVAQEFFQSRILPNLSLLHENAPTLLQKRMAESSRKATEALAHSP